MITAFFAASCLSVTDDATPVQILVSQSPTETRFVSSPTKATPLTVSSTVTPIIISTSIIPPTEIVIFHSTPGERITILKTITQTLPVDNINWQKLPKLSEVILPKQYFESADYYSISVSDSLREYYVTEELGDRCLWDCAKIRYAQSNANWTITLLRAGDNEKAQRTAQNLQKNFEQYIFSEYMPEELPEMLPGSWVIFHESADRYFKSVSTGLSHGPVVVLITFSARMCWDSDEGFKCEGDIYGFVKDLVMFSNARIQNLEGAGYPN